MHQPDPTPQGTGGAGSGWPEVVELVLPDRDTAEARLARRCMRAACRHTVGDHAAAVRRAPCTIEGCGCTSLIEEPPPWPDRTGATDDPHA